MTISIKSPTSTTGSIQLNGNDVLTIDSSGNLTAPNNLTVTGNVSTSGTIPAANLTGALPALDGSALTGVGKVLQLQSTRFTTQTSFSASTSFAEINTGLRVTITPSSTSNKIILEAYIPYSDAGTTRIYNFVFYDVTGSAKVEPGTASGSNRQQALAGWRGEHYDSNDAGWIVLRQVVTAPRTSATTYTVHARAEGSPTMYLNYSTYDGTVGFAWTGVSTVSAMEVSV